jgi:hypothetical protein
VLLDPDHNYKLLSIKYQAYGVNPPVPVSVYQSTLDPAAYHNITAYVAALSPPLPRSGVFQLTVYTGDCSWLAAFVPAKGSLGTPVVGDIFQFVATGTPTGNLLYGGNFAHPYTYTPPAGYSAWTNLNDVYSAGLDPDAQKIGEPFYGFLGITIYMMSSGARTLYGGIDASSGLPKSGQIVPLPLRPMQSGPDHGFLSMRTPYLLSRAGTLIFEVTNNHPSISLFPSALIYGIKVRI